MAKMVNDIRLVVNRIDTEVVCYNDEGSFVVLFPTGDQPIPEFFPDRAYIVDNAEYQRIKESGERPTIDLVRIRGNEVNGETGRSAVKFSYLESFEELESEKTNRPLKITPCRIAQYDEYDREHVFHQLLNL